MTITPDDIVYWQLGPFAISATLVFTWVVMALLAGVTLGCLNAWYWVNQESRMIEKEEAGEDSRR